MKILAINGSYRANGFTDQLLYNLTRTLQEKGADIEQIDLRDYPINFCLNCRECTQHEGSNPGQCIQKDGMSTLIEKIEAADGYILAAPTNFGSITALFKRFMERLLVYAYWPWGKVAPVYRKNKQPQKPAIIVTSSSSPAFITKLFFSSIGELKQAAKVMGARVSSVLNTGLIASKPYSSLDPKLNQRLQAAATRLLAEAN